MLVSVGINAAYYQVSTKLENLWFGRQFDTNLLVIDTNIDNGETLTSSGALSFLDIGIGLSLEAALNDDISYTISLARHHINNPSIGFITDKTLPSRNNIFARLKYSPSSISHSLSISSIIQNPSFQILPSYTIAFSSKEEDSEVSFSIGSRAANSVDNFILDSVIFGAGIDNQKWKASIAYEYALGVESLSTTGTIQLILGYKLPFSE